MKDLNNYIIEKLKIRKSNHSYKYFPETKEQLKELLSKLIEERGDEGDFNDIDTSEITDMSELFRFMKEFNGNISKWDVSNVKDMYGLFWDAKSFNQNISKWNVSKVIDRRWIFQNCPIEEKYKPKFK